MDQLSEIKQELVLAQQHNELIAIYNFNNDETFSVGYIVALDSVFVLIEGIDMEGKLNGLNAIRLTSINHLKRASDYLTTVKIKQTVAQKYGYFDIWHIQNLVKTANFTSHGILTNFLSFSYQQKQPIVVGTRKFKDSDDFNGYINELSAVRLNLHYLDFDDLSSLWERDILLADIDYLRVGGTQSYTSMAILRQVFGEVFPDLK
ncbi:hypothetical protein [Paucilactobacillus kaifaensis]|uniref:hypothetical protein n=1 Tax=Paucilactobacillus kaifaensis TaxID=2559921 RepID=UPI0010F7DD68|nr:hypothetical protein [Paucilactobacillus kaifaensis]